jgi:hypothetical protein
MAIVVLMGIAAIVSVSSDWQTGDATALDLAGTILWTAAALLFAVAYAVGCRRLRAQTRAAARFCRTATLVHLAVWTVWLAAGTADMLRAPEIGVPCLAFGSLAVGWASLILPLWLLRRARACIAASPPAVPPASPSSPPRA